MWYSCELLSKFVSLWFSTTYSGKEAFVNRLWITFKIRTFVISNNTKTNVMIDLSVVNYFQNLYLCDSQQLPVRFAMCYSCCELLSKFVSLWLPTTNPLFLYPWERLWIIFKICIFVTPNNFRFRYRLLGSVVNYFQNLYLYDFQQHQGMNAIDYVGCELLSKFVPLWLPTTMHYGTKQTSLLWITFKICIFVTPNNLWGIIVMLGRVVNYFQNLYLCDFQQH